MYAEENGEERAEKMCMNAFLAAMGDPPANRELSHLVFVEFLVAAARSTLIYATCIFRVHAEVAASMHGRISVEVYQEGDPASSMVVGINQIVNYSINI